MRFGIGRDMIARLTSVRRVSCKVHADWRHMNHLAASFKPTALDSLYVYKNKSDQNAGFLKIHLLLRYFTGVYYCGTTLLDVQNLLIIAFRK